MAKIFTFLTVFIIFSFNSFAQLITVTSPNGGESWQTGYEYTITWIDSIAEDVRIDLYKGGIFDSVLFDSTSSDGSKFWDIPVGTTPGSDYQIKITSVDSSSVFDFSDTTFTIYASFIDITVPNGSVSWQAGTTQTITWNDNIPENVKIDLYNGGVFNSVIVSGTASDGVRNWSIPILQEGGSDYSVKLTSVDNPDIFDFSANFSILGSEVTVIAPNGGEDWLIGSFQNITWNEILVGNVRIDLFKSGVFHSEITGGTVNDSVYIWQIPSTLPPGSDYKVRISSVIESSVFDFSDSDFTLSHQIVVNQPNSGESWQAGTEQSITWTDNINDEVMIELYKGGTLHSVITTSTESDGLKDWDIPYTLASGSDYQVRISSVVDTSVYDTSDANFTIIGNTITIAAPNGGENWLIGSSQKIAWADNFSDNVEMQLYKGGIFQSLITPSTASDGLYTWNIDPAIESGTDYKVRIASVVDGNIFDFSDSSFTLSHQVVVSVPNGGEVWQSGSSKDIEWTDNLTGNVKIELYKGGVFDTTISSSATSNGEYTWAIPITTVEGTDYRIKITSVDDSTVTDMSDADFSIFAGNIMVMAPNGGESWLAGSSQEITWSDNISGNVKIELFKGGVFYSEMISSATSNGSYNWDISDTTAEGSDYKVKISSVENPALFDFSDADFTIFAGSIMITAPNGGESWLAGSSEYITWIDNIDANVSIDFYKGGVFHSVISTSTSSDGTYNWNIPSGTTPASDYIVKITSVNNGSITDESDGNFEITAASFITVNTPNGGESWQAGTQHTITWNDNISENVKIELFKNGSFNSTITASTQSDGSFSWGIPSGTTPASDYTVKITSAADPALKDLSDNNFTILESTLVIDFNANLVISDNCNNSSTLIFGTAPDASDCYDPFHDLYAPPPAPSFTYDSRFTSCKEYLIKDIRATNINSITIWNVYYHPETGCSPITLSWNPNELPTNGDFYLVDPFGESLVNINMRQNSFYTDTFGYDHLQIIFNNSALSINISDGWNTISLPLEVEDNHFKILFPNAMDGTLFGFDGNYYSTDSIEKEKGYWLRFNTSESVNIQGIKIFQSDLLLNSGWNFIGGPACDISYNSILDPAGIIIPGTLFGFDGSYFNADTLMKGKGYWIRANSSGIISLNCGVVSNPAKGHESKTFLADLTEFIKVEIEDNKGNQQKLYFGRTLEDGVNIESYSLPPIPPSGVFDSRITGGYRLSESDEIEISIQSENYPLKVSLTGLNYGNTEGYLIKEFAGNAEVGERQVSAGVELIIDNENVHLLKVQLDSDLPTNFVLEQNYPNPFNPSTKIKYRVPVKGNVILKVVNTLGQEIATLVNEEQLAGLYEVDFNAADLASGIYFYRIKLVDKSGNSPNGPVGQVIVETKKMVLLR